MACRKDKSLPPIINIDITCSNFENLPPTTWFSKEKEQYRTPYFNPNNSEEFIYNYINYELNEYKIIKYNLTSKVKTELTSNVNVISQPKWSKKGWIAFDNVFNYNYQISIIKDNGDSIKEITENKSNLFPVWDTTGIILYWQYDVVLASYPSFFLKKNIYNSFTDTIIGNGVSEHAVVLKSDISSSNRLLAQTLINNKPHIGLSNSINGSFHPLIDLEDQGLIGLTSLTWGIDSQIAYFTIYGNGLYKLNTLTGNYTKLIQFCDSKRYEKISCSVDGEKMIAERVDSYLVKNYEGKPSGEIIEKSTIYLIDLETLEETKINLE